MNFIKISAECVSDCCGLMQNIHHDVKSSMSFRDVAATGNKNICNRGLSRAGVQLEISKKLRDALSKEPDQLKKFVRAIRGVLIVSGTGNIA